MIRPVRRGSIQGRADSSHSTRGGSENLDDAGQAVGAAAVGDPLVEVDLERSEQVDLDALVRAGLEDVGERVPARLEAVGVGPVVAGVDFLSEAGQHADHRVEPWDQQ